MAARTATAIRFQAEIHEQLVVYSDALGVPINWLVNQAVREYIAGLAPPDEVEIRLTAKDRPHGDDR